MSRLKFLCLGILIPISLFLFIASLHQAEQENKRAWKIKAISAIDLISEKSKDKNCSKEELKALQDSLAAELDRSYPSKCPYCFIEEYLSR